MDIQTLRFIIIASVLYGLFHFAYYKVPDEVLRTKVYPTIIGHLAAKTINTITPDRNVRVRDHAIISDGVKLNIVRGCDGSGVLFMLIAAILGFGATVRQTLVGLVLGTLTVYVINQVRIVGLFYVIEHNRMWFPPVHTYFAPTLIIFLIAGFFLAWTHWATSASTAKPSSVQKESQENGG